MLPDRTSLDRAVEEMAQAGAERAKEEYAKAHPLLCPDCGAHLKYDEFTRELEWLQHAP